MADSVEAKLSELGVRDPEAEEVEAGSEHDARSDSQGHGSGSSAVPKDQKLIVKFLMSNAAAGAIIGKGGASIAELQDNSGARLQLSRAAEFFPGTADRVMLIAGTLNAVLAALHLVLTKVQSEQVFRCPGACLAEVIPSGRTFAMSRCKSPMQPGSASAATLLPDGFSNGVRECVMLTDLIRVQILLMSAGHCASFGVLRQACLGHTFCSAIAAWAVTAWHVEQRTYSSSSRPLLVAPSSREHAFDLHTSTVLPAHIDNSAPL